MRPNKIACLTLDFEQDYGTLAEQPHYDGLNLIPQLVNVLKRENVPLTCFVQGSILETHPDQVNMLNALEIEFEPHSYSHPPPEKMNFESEVGKSVDSYRSFFGEEPIGYRSPDGYIESCDYFQILSDHGLKYDSSVFPSFRPGRFCNLRSATKPLFIEKHSLYEFPISVLSNIIRIPTGLSYMKLIGHPYVWYLKKGGLPELIVFDFHLHDLERLPSYSTVIRKQNVSSVEYSVFKKVYGNQGNSGFSKLLTFIQIMKQRNYTFMTLAGVYKALNNRRSSLITNETDREAAI